MAKAQTTLELRPATIADGQQIADLETARTPDEPRDPEMLHFRWTVPPAGGVVAGMLAAHAGGAIPFLYPGHIAPGQTPKRFAPVGLLRPPHTGRPQHSHTRTD